MDWGDFADLDAVLIAGPTASGKSALAVAAAKALGGAVINADSMQVYGGLAILSARPTESEMGGVQHHLYGFVDPRRAYSVGDYLADAAPVLATLRDVNRTAIIVGGTGLYFRALTEGLVETPVVPPEVRAGLEAEAAAGIDMMARLRAVDPEAGARLSPVDLPRILRALEVVEFTGRPLAAWQAAQQGVPLLAPGRWRGIFLNPARETLNRRIDMRFVQMIESGALEEVRAIAGLGLPANRGIMKAHGMPHLIAHLNGAMTLEAAVAAGQQDTRRYAKRQVTWARKFMAGWRWVEVG